MVDTYLDNLKKEISKNYKSEVEEYYSIVFLVDSNDKVNIIDKSYYDKNSIDVKKYNYMKFLPLFYCKEKQGYSKEIKYDFCCSSTYPLNINKNH